MYNKYVITYFNLLSTEERKIIVAQVIHNLLDNALKFTTTHMQQLIFVSIDKKKKESQEEEDEEVIVSVKDTGEDISKKVI
jgi:signal transduction histidine kinase